MGNSVKLLILLVFGWYLSSVAKAQYKPYQMKPSDVVDRACAGAETTPAMNACLGKALQEIDDELNRAYQIITQHLKKKGVKSAMVRVALANNSQSSLKNKMLKR